MNDPCCGPDESRGALPLSITPAPAEKHDGVTDDCCGGTSASPDQGTPAHTPFTPRWRDRALLLPVISGLLLAVGHVLEWTGLERAGTVVLAGSVAAGAWTFVPGALRRLVKGKLGVGLLMTIAAAGAIALGHVGEAAALAFLFSIAEALEHRAMDKARHGLRALLTLIPQTARIEGAGGHQIVPSVQLRPGDVLLVGAGERIATDGVIIEGRSSLDASAVTGESIPVEVGESEGALAGSINGAGSLRIRATSAGNDNSLTTIVRLVERAQARKGERARLADRIARPLVPLVLGLAGIVALYGLIVSAPGVWIERALVVLVAASPCALAIAVPVTVVSAIGAASRFGVVIKSGEAFEQLGTVATIAFDKTGTLTRNEPVVVHVATRSGHSPERVLSLAAALEATSTHPLAHAILAASPAPSRAQDVIEHAGRGITGTVQGAGVRVGSPRWIDVDTLAADATAWRSKG